MSWRITAILCVGVAAVAMLLPSVCPASDRDLLDKMILSGIALFVAVGTLVFRLIEIAKDRRWLPGGSRAIRIPGRISKEDTSTTQNLPG